MLVIKMEEKHYCCYCGEQANFQLKNGKWCCKSNARSCPSIRNKVSQKSKQKWEQLKEQGIKRREEIPQNLREYKKDLGIEGICYYCGYEAKYQLKNGRWCCSKNYQSCPQIRLKNSKKRKEQCLSGEYKNNLKNYAKKGHVAWNKGLTKETDQRINKSAQTLRQKYLNKQIIPPQLGKAISEWVKNKISLSMKKAHAEGRAHNIGTSRWNNKPSYPQQFFIEVINNQFENKNYIKQYPFFKYSLDFAWVELKKVIEIDGEQHQRFDDYKKRDQKKDKLLKENDWKIMRIKWKDMYKDSKFWIEKAKQFIDDIK